jgi:hypothetical protein
VNGNTLRGKSNTAAMETLRRAMQKESPLSGKIHLVVSRKKEQFSTLNISSSSSREIRISQSDQSDVGRLSSSEATSEIQKTDTNANKKECYDLNSRVSHLKSKSMDGLRNTSYQLATMEDTPGKKQVHLVYTKLVSFNILYT